MVVILGSLPPLAHAEEVPGDGLVLLVVPVLVPLLTVTIKHQDWQTSVVLRVLLVQTKLLVKVPDLPRTQDLVTHELRHLLLQIPLETLALQRLSQRYSLAHITEVSHVVLQAGSSDAESVVVEILVLIHPHLRHPLVVILWQLHFSGPLVGTDKKICETSFSVNLLRIYQQKFF